MGEGLPDFDGSPSFRFYAYTFENCGSERAKTVERYEQIRQDYYDGCFSHTEACFKLELECHVSEMAAARYLKSGLVSDLELRPAFVRPLVQFV